MSAAVGPTGADPIGHTKPVQSMQDDSSSSSVFDTNGGTEQQVKHDQEIFELARKFTSQSQQHHLGSPFDINLDDRLDPKKDSFRAKEWARSFYELRYSSEETVPRVAGVAFRGLNVWGKGSPTDFQSTVGNKILKLPALFGRGTQKIDILQDLDGLLLPGEQLCVLGPPG